MENTQLEELKAQAALAATGIDLKWDDSPFYGGSSTAEIPGEGYVQVMCDPPNGQPSIQMLDKNFRSKTFESSELPETGVLVVEEEDVDVDPIDDRIKTTTVGLEIVGKVTVEEVRELMMALFRKQKAIRWWIADLLNYASVAWPDQFDQIVADVAKDLDVDPRTVMQYLWVGRRVPESKRFENVPWSTYRSLAYIDHPDALDVGVQAKLNGSTTEEAVETARNHIAETSPSQQNQDVEERPPCPFCGGKTTSRSCKECGSDFEDVVWYLNDLIGEVKALLLEGTVGKKLDALRSSMEGEANEH